MKLLSYPYSRKAVKYSKLIWAYSKLKLFSDLDPSSPYAVGRVVVYPEAGIVYNRVRKSGNSSTLAFLAELLIANGVVTKKSYTMAQRLTKRSSKSLGKTIYALPVGDFKKINDFCFFTVVRNPYSRLLSAYLHKQGEAKKGNLAYQKVPGMLLGGVKGFWEFVSFVESGGLYKDSHWWPQKDLLFVPVERFDKIVELESLADDREALTQTQGLRNIPKKIFEKPHYTEASLSGKVTRSSERLPKYYDAVLMKKVYEIYKGDFDAFQYDSSDLG